MKKILWLSDVIFSDKIHSGGWVQSMALKLQQSRKMQIYNITLGDVSEITQCNYKEIKQWVIPNRKKKGYGHIPANKTCEEVKEIAYQISPDLIHIWGTEHIWAYIYHNGYLKSPAIMEIQGVLFSIPDYYYGGLSFSEILQCIHLKEILMPWRTLFHKKKVLKNRGKYEINFLKSFQYIGYQSEWTKNQLLIINSSAKYYKARLMLRESFYNAESWQYKTVNNAPIIFSSCNAAVSYKGLHILIKAISLLKNKYPYIRLNLAGNIDVGDKLLDGYSVFLQKLIKKLDLEKNVCYLGFLNENQIIHHLQACNVCIVPSFVETYCVALAEAMIIGVPTVVSFAGAMPELGVHGISALYYNSIDYGMCATYIDQLIQDKRMSELLSYNARESKLKYHNSDIVVNNQLDIYESILNSNK
jgi:glycosyltransferase involved in cell wall biosynthesis